jgi:lipoate synthase
VGDIKHATCKNGHKWTKKNTQKRMRGKQKTRECKICSADRVKRWRAAQKEETERLLSVK